MNIKHPNKDDHYLNTLHNLFKAKQALPWKEKSYKKIVKLHSLAVNVQVNGITRRK